MVAKLTEESYCPMLDELLRFYIILWDRTELSGPRGIYFARKYLERTQYSFEEIKARTNVKLRNSDFVFEGRLTHRERNGFVMHFETFLYRIAQVIGYINGTVKQL
jgi:hypothetical protein